MWNDKMKKENYGFFKAERLQGNIGYIDFRTNYAGLDFSKETIKAAMGFLSNSDAIIFDLRKTAALTLNVFSFYAVTFLTMNRFTWTIYTTGLMIRQLNTGP